MSAWALKKHANHFYLWVYFSVGCLRLRNWKKMNNFHFFSRKWSFKSGPQGHWTWEEPLSLLAIVLLVVPAMWRQNKVVVWPLISREHWGRIFSLLIFLFWEETLLKVDWVGSSWPPRTRKLVTPHNYWIFQEMPQSLLGSTWSWRARGQSIVPLNPSDHISADLQTLLLNTHEFSHTKVVLLTVVWYLDKAWPKPKHF